MGNGRATRRWVLLILWSWQLAAAQAQQVRPTERGLVGLVPQNAFFVVEGRGLKANDGTWQKTTFGKLIADPAVAEAVAKSTRNIESEVVSRLFMPGAENVEKYRKQLHQITLALWRRESLLFLTPPAAGKTRPGLGGMLRYGPDRKELVRAVDGILEGVVKHPGNSWESRLLFTWTAGASEWRGIAISTDRIELTDAQKADPDKLRKAVGDDLVVLVSTSHPLLLLADSFETAEAMSAAFSAGARKPPSWLASADRVWTASQMQHWAIRWYVDLAWVRKHLQKSADAKRTAKQLELLGLEKMAGLGGHSGYADGYWAHTAMIELGGVERGLAGALAPGGDYRDAVKLLPTSSVVALAGTFDAQAVMKMVQGLDEMERHGELTEKDRLSMQGIAKLHQAGTGQWFLSLGDDRAVGGELYFVGGVKDRKVAREAMEQVAKSQGRKPKWTRSGKYELINTEEPAMGLGPDRFVLGQSAEGLKWAVESIDAQKPDKQVLQLARLAGPGQAVFYADSKEFIEKAWPMVGFMYHKPLVVVPSIDKVGPLLTPEVFILQRVEGGIRMTGRGTLPLFYRGGMIGPILISYLLG